MVQSGQDMKRPVLLCGICDFVIKIVNIIG